MGFSVASKSSFDVQRAEAKKYEEALARYFQRKYGALTLATYDYNGMDNKAPKLMAWDSSSSLVIPDLLVCLKGRTSWVECKWKAEATLHRVTGDLTTGISARHFRHYQLVQEQSGCAVSLMFLHVAEGEMRGAKLAELPPIHHVYDGGKMGYAGMIFWKYDSLPRICSLDEIIPK